MNPKNLQKSISRKYNKLNENQKHKHKYKIKRKPKTQI